MERILIIINKSWEADAVCSALFNADFKLFPKKFKQLFDGITIKNLHYPWDITLQGTGEPAVIFIRGNFQIELWCLNNVMTPNPNTSDPFYFSRAFQKAIDMPKIIKYSADPIALVVAYGTAGAPTEISKNGCLVIGSNIFPWDSRLVPENLLYINNKMDQLIPSTVSQDLFDQMNLQLAVIDWKLFFESCMLAPPINPATFQIFADSSIVAVGDINVNSYTDFDICDKEALAAYAALQNLDTAYSIETTHGVIRLECGCDNFMFISAITDRDAYFDNEVTPKNHAQNFSAAFNGGVFMNWFIPFLFNYYKA